MRMTEAQSRSGLKPEPEAKSSKASLDQLQPRGPRVRSQCFLLNATEVWRFVTQQELTDVPKLKKDTTQALLIKKRRRGRVLLSLQRPRPIHHHQPDF